MLFRKRKLSNFNQLHVDISDKANRVLNIILVVLVLYGIRVWHLGVYQYEEKKAEFLRPQQKVKLTHAERGSIRDRFGVPLAVNQIRYNAAISYKEVRDIPAIVWVKDKKRKRQKVYKRKEYIKKLSKVLGDVVHISPDRIDDLIHSKASILFDAPLVIKEDISEEEYYRLQMLEKDWPGLVAQITSKRFYPQGKVGGDIIGYMGAINQQEYESFYSELKGLKNFKENYSFGSQIEPLEGYKSPNEIFLRLKDLEDKAFTIHDWVGKTGVESKYEHKLRGYHGKEVYLSDAKGNYLRHLPLSRTATPGKRVVLTISSELQEYAERLLVENERVREGRSVRYDQTKGTYTSNKQPWIKGGAIVALDPNNGEILALASYPRIDPNDFISSGKIEEQQLKLRNIRRWFEGERYIESIWDRKIPFSRERVHFDHSVYYDEEMDLTLENFLDLILPKESLVTQSVERIKTVKGAYELQCTFARLLELSGVSDAWDLLTFFYHEKPHKTYPENNLTDKNRLVIQERLDESSNESKYLKQQLDRVIGFIPSNYDKLLVVDLCRLLVCNDRFSQQLLDEVGIQSLSDYRSACAYYSHVYDTVKSLVRGIYREEDFSKWREENQKAYLKQKRKKERERKTYARPYIDYLDKKENKMFSEFWKENKWIFISLFLGIDFPDRSDVQVYIDDLNQWKTELSKGAHQGMEWHRAYCYLSKTIEGFSRENKILYVKTLRRFSDLDRSLYGTYRNVTKPTEKHLAMSFYRKFGYGYGRSYAFRQATPQGSIFKVVTAYEVLRQRYYDLNGEVKSPYQLNPLTIIDDLHKSNKEGWNVGYFLDGRPIPQYYKGGRLPKSHRQGLGKIDLLTAMEMTSNPYFSLIASECIKDPQDLMLAAKDFSYGEKTGIDLPAEYGGNLPEDIVFDKTGLYSIAIGQHSLNVTPLQTAVMLASIANGGKVLKPKIIKSIIGEQPRRRPNELFSKEDFACKSSLNLLGIDFPLFTASAITREVTNEQLSKTEVIREIEMPQPVQEILLESMYRVVHGEKGTANWKRIRSFPRHHYFVQDYKKVSENLIGKTSSSEVIESVDLDLYKGTNMYKHVWFGGVYYEEKGRGHIWKKTPEIVVVVYLPFGDYGKETTPIAGQVITKWKEIKSREEVVGKPN